MCGIAGWIGPSNQELLTKVRDSIRHRGPDDGRSFFDSQVSLGHRRLNIVDLATGGQPMFSEDRTLVIVFNGEIYNHPKLKIELQGLGHRYRTSSDTESILHAYVQWGTKCVERIDGMFVFAIYDMKNKLLFGARDRFGKKSLYYTNRPLGSGSEQFAFAFSSELKALRKISQVENLHLYVRVALAQLAELAILSRY